MSIAAPRTEEERKIADLLDQGFDAGWSEAFDAAIAIVNRYGPPSQPIIDELLACKEGRSSLIETKPTA